MSKTPGPAVGAVAGAGPASATSAATGAGPASATGPTTATVARESAPSVPSPRVCFQLQVRPERMAEYRERHSAVWPEMLRALKRTGWNNYSLFIRTDGLLIGYVETPDLAAAQQGMAATEVNARWQGEMNEFFVELDGDPDRGFTALTEVFHLEDQLAALDATPTLDKTPGLGATPPTGASPTLDTAPALGLTPATGPTTPTGATPTGSSNS